MKRRDLLQGLFGGAVAMSTTGVAAAQTWEHREIAVRLTLCKHKYVAVFAVKEIEAGAMLPWLPWPIPECVHCGHRPTEEESKSKMDF